jgi:hypothetical protein
MRPPTGGAILCKRSGFCQWEDFAPQRALANPIISYEIMKFLTKSPIGD